MFFEDKRILYFILAIFIITGMMGMTQSRINKSFNDIASGTNCNNFS